MTRVMHIIGAAALAALAFPAWAQDLPDFAAPCLVEDHSAEAVTAAYEAAGWQVVEDAETRDRINGALAVLATVNRFLPSGDVTPEALGRIERFATTDYELRSNFSGNTLYFERDGEVSTWLIMHQGRLYQVVCEFAADDLNAIDGLLSPPPRDLPLWFSSHFHRSPGEGFETITTAIRLEVDVSDLPMPVLRDGYSVVRNWEDPPQ